MLHNRSWVTSEHLQFAEAVSKFFELELTPNIDRWREAGVVDRDFWRKAGGAGLLGASIPVEYGGSGCDFSFDAVVCTQQTMAGDGNWGWSAHNIVSHYVLGYGTKDQKERWLPQLVSGEQVAAIAMTEPDTGSDLQAIKTRAVAVDGGYKLNGSKIYITNGQTADVIFVVCKTDSNQGAKGISLIAVEPEKSEGFRRGRNLKKLGIDGADTSELFFDDVFVPEENLLGKQEGLGFIQLMSQLPWERLMLGIISVASMEDVIDRTLDFVKQRKAFGKRVFDCQNTQFKLVECQTKMEVTRAFVDECILELGNGQLTAEKAAMAKWWSTDVGSQVIDECLQLHGGAGLMLEYPVAHYYRDSRFGKIVGGTNEIMKTILARAMDKD